MPESDHVGYMATRRRPGSVTLSSGVASHPIAVPYAGGTPQMTTRQSGNADS